MEIGIYIHPDSGLYYKVYTVKIDEEDILKIGNRYFELMQGKAQLKTGEE